MSFSREELFNLLPQLVAKSSKPFGHPARVKIILHLMQHGITPFHDLHELLPLHQSTVSQHLRLLLRNNLVVVHERIPHTYYGLNFEELRRYMVATSEFLRQLTEHGIHPQDMIVPKEEYEGYMRDVGE